ncbi:MAG TPA: hypothetical protein PLT04_04800 [Candidatus Saccharibacteria bacterium]|nr:hypothetical protein [Candidatus Saccharibacteria bacterium]
MKKLSTDGGVLLATNQCKSGARMLRVSNAGYVRTATRAAASATKLKPRAVFLTGS